MEGKTDYKAIQIGSIFLKAVTCMAHIQNTSGRGARHRDVNCDSLSSGAIGSLYYFLHAFLHFELQKFLEYLPDKILAFEKLTVLLGRDRG